MTNVLNTHEFFLIVKEEMIKQKYSIASLSRASGYTKRSLHYWFGGQFDIGMSKAFVLADILKIKIKIKTK